MPAAVDQQPRELTLETIFVPPGEDGETESGIEHVRVSHRGTVVDVRCKVVRCFRAAAVTGAFFSFSVYNLHACFVRAAGETQT